MVCSVGSPELFFSPIISSYFYHRRSFSLLQPKNKMSNSPLKEYFTTSVEPRRATLLVQGGHRSGKTTLLNALLGYHAFPYFASDHDAIHGQSTSRYAAGLGSTAVCALNIAKVADGTTSALSAVKPAGGEIIRVVVPSSLLSEEEAGALIQRQPNGTNIQAREDAPQGDTATSDSTNNVQPASSEVFVDADPSAFCMVDAHKRRFSGSSDDFEVVTTEITSSTDPWVSRPIQAFYYDAVETMENGWKNWAKSLPKLDAAGMKARKVTDLERMLFMMRVTPAAAADTEMPSTELSAAEKLLEIPLLNCVEGTELSDRPPMTFVHSNVVVITDEFENPLKTANTDSDGAQRMYIQTALFTQTHTEPILVYNLFKADREAMGAEVVEEVRSRIARKWNIPLPSVFILNLRKALADVMLAQSGTTIGVNKKEVDELRRLRGIIANSHVESHARFVKRAASKNIPGVKEAWQKQQGVDAATASETASNVSRNSSFELV